jgi:hypothetical protein
MKGLLGRRKNSVLVTLSPLSSRTLRLLERESSAMLLHEEVESGRGVDGVIWKNVVNGDTRREGAH